MWSLALMAFGLPCRMHSRYSGCNHLTPPPLIAKCYRDAAFRVSDICKTWIYLLEPLCWFIISMSPKILPLLCRLHNARSIVHAQVEPEANRNRLRVSYNFNYITGVRRQDNHRSGGIGQGAGRIPHPCETNSWRRIRVSNMRQMSPDQKKECTQAHLSCMVRAEQVPRGPPIHPHAKLSDSSSRAPAG